MINILDKNNFLKISYDYILFPFPAVKTENLGGQGAVDPGSVYDPLSHYSDNKSHDLAYLQQLHSR